MGAVLLYGGIRGARGLTFAATEVSIERGVERPGLSPGAGCLVIGIGFLVSGVVFIWMFFSRAASSGKGNPYMALFGGAVFVVIGLLAIAAFVLSVLPSPAFARRPKSGR